MNNTHARLSVNINKFATLRNSRGGNNPDLVHIAYDCERFGAEGITVHPRPDERHIRYADVTALKPLLHTEFNIEGNPKEAAFVALVLATRPAQVTLVPDAQNQLTSDHGWDTVAEQGYLQDIIGTFHAHGIRTSLFLNPDPELISAAKTTRTDRIELYTEAYARQYAQNRENAIKPFVEAAMEAQKQGLGLNAGHDLSLENLGFFALNMPGLLEVSIGHALVCDALYLGLENTIQLYLRALRNVAP